MTEKSVDSLWAKHWIVHGTWVLTKHLIRVNTGPQGHPILLFQGGFQVLPIPLRIEALQVRMDRSDYTIGIEGFDTEMAI